MNVNIRVPQSQIKRLNKLAVKYGKRGIEGEIYKALRKATTKTLSATSSPQGMSQVIRKQLNVKASDLKKFLKKLKKPNRATMTSKVYIDSTGRLPLKHFGARQTKKGVTYKIEKQGKRKTALSAFGVKPKMIESLGGHAYRREEGAARLPIRKLWGISVWGFATKNRMEKQFAQIAKKRLKLEIKERIRYLKKTGWGSKKKPKAKA